MTRPKTPTKTDTLLQTVADEYLKNRERRKAVNTFRGERTAVDGVVGYLGPKTKMNAITAEEVEEYFYGLTISNSTFNVYLNRTKRFFIWAQQRGYIAIDPTYLVEKKPVDSKVRVQPSPVEMLSFLDHADSPRDRAFLAFCLNSALRANEITRLRYRDVHLDQGLIEITISKSHKSALLPISSDLDKELRIWLTEYSKKIRRNLRPDDYLFPAQSGNWILRYEDGEPVRCKQHLVPDRPLQQAHNVVKKILEKAGYEDTKGEGVHTIRRAAALAFFTAASQEMGDISALRETAAFLHHELTSTTEGYLGFKAEELRMQKRLKGQPFLTAMVPKDDNVIPLRRVSSSTP